MEDCLPNEQQRNLQSGGHIERILKMYETCSLASLMSLSIKRQPVVYMTVPNEETIKTV